MLRFVNVPIDESTYFAIAGHNLTVVGIDGAYVKPIVSSFIMMAPGQTMDVLLTANQSLGEYYMATRNYFSTTLRSVNFIQINATAILQYRGTYNTSLAPLYPRDTLPYTTDYKTGINFTAKFRSLASKEHPVDVPKSVTTRMFVTVSVNENSEDFFLYLAASLNNVTWVDPDVSVLEAYYWYVLIINIMFFR